MGIYADLHCHTNASDGVMRLDEVPKAARQASVNVVAVTDHDRIHPGLGDVMQEVNGVTLIRSVELKVESEELGGRVDLLGYGARRRGGLERELDRVQQGRIERGEKIISKVEDHLDIEMDFDVTTKTARPHIARAIANHPETGHGYQSAFDSLIGNGCPCFVPRYVTDFETGSKLLKESCGLVALAHPYRYPNTKKALELTESLGAVEYHYAYGHQTNDELVENAIEKYDLIPTGGTDAHGKSLGRAGLSEEEYEVFLEAADLKRLAHR